MAIVGPAVTQQVFTCPLSHQLLDDDAEFLLYVSRLIDHAMTNARSDN
jgi:hypothetical protein